MAETSRQLILDYLNACYSGDLERAAAYYDDNIDYICYAPVELFPALGQKRGKAEMVASLADLHTRFDSFEYKVKFIAAEAERVAASLVLRMRSKDNDRIVHSEVGNFYTLRDGRIVIYRQFIDSFDRVQQMLGRDIVGAVLKSVG